MFSATWSEVRVLAHEIGVEKIGMRPVFVRIGGDKLAACKGIIQQTVVVDGDEEKYENIKEQLPGIMMEGKAVFSYDVPRRAEDYLKRVLCAAPDKGYTMCHLY
eukprot:s181_g43.t1